jgi:hypothetical protein
VRARGLHIAKYEAQASAGAAAGEGQQAVLERPSQAGIEMHRDGSLLNCVILLNPRDAFDGGGTAFAPPLDQVHATQVGGCLCSCGQLRHGAAAVTRGVRYVLIAFLDDQQLPPDDSDDDEDDEEKGEQESVAGQGVPEGEAAQGVTGGLSEHTQLLSSWTLRRPSCAASGRTRRSSCRCLCGQTQTRIDRRLGGTSTLLDSRVQSSEFIRAYNTNSKPTKLRPYISRA